MRPKGVAIDGQSLAPTRSCPNPFRPGAGHTPPHLAGREQEKREFSRLLDQDTVFQNLVVTGLRGVGKTVLLDTLKPIAIEKSWFWVGTDMSESSSLDEASLLVRLITDLSVVTSGIAVQEPQGTGFVVDPNTAPKTLDFATLLEIVQATPGLNSDKLKAVLELVWGCVESLGIRGVVFAYDEAQNLSDHAADGEFPLSTLLEVFQSVQRKGMRLLLVLTGLSTLTARLVEARTYAERMFRILSLERLTREATAEAILRPVRQDSPCVAGFTEDAIEVIYDFTLGYPYFVQYVCREVFDLWAQDVASGEELREIPLSDITRKLDSDFFAGRWARATDRQRDLLSLVARLETSAGEFTVQEIVAKSKESSKKPFSPSHVNQLLAALCETGLVYKSRWGKYSLAVPLLDGFIRRQLEDGRVGAGR